MKQKIKCDKEDLNRFAPVRPSFGMSAFSIKSALSQDGRPIKRKKQFHFLPLAYQIKKTCIYLWHFV